MSGLMFSLAGCVGLALLGEALGRQILKTLGFVLAVPLVIFFVVRLNRAGKK